MYVWATFVVRDGEADVPVGDSDTDIWLYANGDSRNNFRDSDDDVLYLSPGRLGNIGVPADTENLNEDQGLTAAINANANKPTGGGAVVGSGATPINGPTDGIVNYWPLDDADAGA